MVDAPFTAVAGVNLVVCLALGWLTRSKAGVSPPQHFDAHLRHYLIAWTFCIAGEWFGGPGVYALYASYGFTHGQTAQLYVLGFACSSVLGCFAGAWTDRFGRKRSALLYCMLGVLSCMLKHVPWFPALVVCRFADGAHASLLYTSFESWLVSEHFTRHGFPPELLGHSFSLMFTISYLTAVLCGMATQVGVDHIPAQSLGALKLGGWGFPFEASALFQLVGGVYIAQAWGENYGNSPAASASDSPEKKGLLRALGSPRVLLCGALVSFFESSMFIFVFSWTPALTPGSDHAKVPGGLVFATYMMACMSGSSVYSLCCGRFHITAIVGVIFAVAATAMAVPSIGGISEENKLRNFLAFVLFEFSVGGYFPAVATMKSELVEETHRNTIYNVFRTPMNLIVVAVLLTGPPLLTTFRLLAAQLALGALLLAIFNTLAPDSDEKARPLLPSGSSTHSQSGSGANRGRVSSDGT